MLAYHRMRALHACSGKPQISKAAKRTRVLHLEAGSRGEKFGRTGDILGLLLEPCEHAAGQRPAAVMDQQIGISERRETVIKSNVTIVCKVSVKNISGGNNVGCSRSSCQDRRSLDFLDAIAEPDLCAAIDGLL